MCYDFGHLFLLFKRLQETNDINEGDNSMILKMISHYYALINRFSCNMRTT